MPPFDSPPPFEEGLHVSPYELFRRLANGERPPMVDLRAIGRSLVGATRGESGGAFAPGTILIDRDGLAATEAARRDRAEGRDTRALYGGIELWDFALDPLVVGEQRFLSD
jgi:hypothetical protein